MKNYLLFIRRQWAILLFGFLTVFGGNVGQSFFVGLFGESIQQSLGLSASRYSVAYSLATLFSAATVMWLGGIIDRISLTRFTTFVCFGLTLAALVMWQASSFVWLAVGFFLLRLFGQALLPHAGITTMARVFATERGKALSIAGTGAPAGAVVLPLAVGGLIVTIGWQQTYLVIAVLVLVLLWPLLLWLIRHGRIEPVQQTQSIPAGADTGQLSARRALLTDYRYWLALPALMAGPFVATGIFMHQNFIIATKGWTLAWFGVCYMVFGVVHWLSSLTAGVLVDRFTATRLLPWFPVPLAMALLVLSLMPGPAGALLMMVLLGVGIGISPPISGSLWPEIYGTGNLGAIRSINIGVMVFATSLSPVLYGVLIDRGMALSTIMLSSAVYVTLSCVLMGFSYFANERRHPMAG